MSSHAARVLRAAEAAKRQLSFHPFIRLEEEFIAEKDGQALHLQMEIEREEYENLILPLIQRTMDCVQRALEDAKLTPPQIDKVVLVGGSTRTPLVSRWLEDRLGQPAHQEVDPDLCVAMGAAIQAALIGGEDVGAILVDITPHSLGIRCISLMHGMDFAFRFAPIIRRNTALPASRSEGFFTVADNQKEVEIEIFQGENDDVRFNHCIGNFHITGLADVPAGNQIVVQCDLNLDGMLKVSAKEKVTGLSKQVTIENALARFDGAEISEARDRLDRLWDASVPANDDEYSEEDDADFEDDEDDNSAAPELVLGPREGQRETVQARALLEKAERLLEKVPAEDKVELERMLNAVRHAITERQWEQVTKACNELSDILFYLEEA